MNLFASSTGNDLMDAITSSEAAIDYGVRRVLCVFPHYEPSFGTFEYSYPVIEGVKAFMPPQGILVIAASMPKS